MSIPDPTRFVWTDLAAVDSNRAAEFYTALFGWRVEKTELSQEHHYLTFMCGESPVCGVFQLSADQLALGGTSFWTSYLKVDDVDRVAVVARMQGATIVVEPFDMGEKGRTAVLQDPGGAVFALRNNYERDHLLKPGVGTITSYELRALDSERSQNFYHQLLGWESSQTSHPSDSWRMSVGQESVASVCRLSQHGSSVDSIPQWVFYVGVEDIEETVARALTLGATQADPQNQPPTSPDRVVLLDPTGSLFGITNFPG